MKNTVFNILTQQALRTAVCLVFLSGSFAVYAQDEAQEAPDTVKAVKMRPKKVEPTYEMRTVKGSVIDGATKSAMGGVRVQALGNSRYSALTEEDGTFTLQVPVFVSVLYVYAPEYCPVHEAVKDGALTIELISDKFKSFYGETNHVVSKSSFNVVNSSSVNIETDIQNHLNGDVRTVNHNGLPGMGAFMNIHGINSINANTQPLIVLDGNIVDTQLNRETLHEGFFHNILAGIDPETVESIEVMKNGTALYGAKGGNGVIFINTKRGKSMATKINVNIFAGAEFTPKTLPMMNGEQYRSYLSDLVSTSSKFADTKNASGASSLTSMFGFLNPNPAYPYYNVYHNNTDWNDGLYRTAWTQNYKVNVEGGDERGMYALQLGYTRANSTAKGNDFDRLSLRFNTDINVFKSLFAGIDISYNQTTYNVLDQGWSSDYSMQNIGSPNVLGLVQSPFLNKNAYVRNTVTGALELTNDLAGKYAASSSDPVANPFGFTRDITENFSLRNPYWIIANGEGKNKNYAEVSQMGINFAPRWEVNKHLTISDRFNYSMYRVSERYFLPINGSNPYTLTDLGNITSVLKSLFSKETIINNDLRIDWKNKYGAHDIHVFGGWRVNKFSYNSTSIRGYNNENDKLPVINATMQFVNYDGINDNWLDMTYYLAAQYNYANRYYVDFSASAMTSSRFGKNTNQGMKLGGVSWGLFPSVQLGWVISNEKWFPTSRGINFLKLTAGFDMSGNDEIDNYAARTYWASQTVSKTTVGLVLENIANSNIQWETTTRWNIGLEGSFVNNRIQAGIDIFFNRTSNLLMRVAPNYLTGLASGWTNDGELTNRGFDFHANVAVINTRDFKWQLGASLGHYNNKITKLPDSYTVRDEKNNVLLQNAFTNSIYGTDNILTAVGESVGTFYGYQTAGVFASQKDADQANLQYYTGNNTVRKFKAGDVHFVDQNGDGIISAADKVVIGNPNPDIYGNITTSFMYKRLRLDVLFKYSLGNDVYNYQRSQIEAGSNLYNQSAAMANRWTHEGQVAAQPRAVYTDSEDWVNNERFSDRWIEDGSYLKLKNVRLTYDFPWTTTWLQGLKIWAEGNNLFTVTKYLGTDPEVSCTNSTLYQGIDAGYLPLGRSINFGLSINF